MCRLKSKIVVKKVFEKSRSFYSERKQVLWKANIHAEMAEKKLSEAFDRVTFSEHKY